MYCRKRKTQPKQVEPSKRLGVLVGVVKIVILNKLVRISFSGKVLFKQRDKGVNQAYIQDKEILAIGTASAKALELVYVWIAQGTVRRLLWLE